MSKYIIHGEIERLCKQLGLPTPLNSVLLGTVNEMSHRRELPGKYSAKEMGLTFQAIRGRA